MKRFRPSRRTLIVLSLLIVTVCVGFIVFTPHEPSYNGRTLHEWLARYDPSNSNTNNEAESAIRHIGTNGIPTLLSMMATRDSSLKTFVINHAPEKWIERLGLGQSFVRFYSRSRSEPTKAMYGFNVLGPSASNAVPGLVHILRTSDNKFAVENEIPGSLWAIGPPARTALPDLVRSLRSPHPPLQIFSSFPNTRIMAIWGLASEDGVDNWSKIKMKWSPEALPILMPALIEGLKDTNYDRVGILFILETIGPDAKAAIPSIQPLLNSTDFNVRSLATNAFKAINPATNSGPK